MEFVTQTLTSRDATRLSYRTIGQGPALVILPGALAGAGDYAALARPGAIVDRPHPRSSGAGRQRPAGLRIRDDQGV
jgi:hypothetical protein